MPEQAHLITLSGMPGSGKSSTAKALAKRLGYEHISGGDLMRAIGQRRGLSIEETNRVAETDPSFDAEVDGMLREMNSRSEAIIDSRIAFHWIPGSFKVFLKLDPHTAAERTYTQIQTTGRFAQNGSSVDEVYQNLLGRIESERKRYEATYNGLDYLDEHNYDLVVDTALHPLQEVVAIIAEKYKNWLAE